jgi:soluble P-type ATPase
MSVISAVNSGLFGGGSGGGTLAEVLADGNSAGAYSINMNDNNINNCLDLTTVGIIGSDVLTITNYVAGEDLNIASGGNLNLFFGNVGGLTLDGEAGTVGQVLISSGVGVAPTWGTGGGGDVGTLTEVLANGNSAGALDIDMNNNDIDNVNVLGVSSVEGPADDDLNLLSSGGFDIVINSDADIVLNTGTNGVLFINNDAGTVGQVLTSGGSLASPVWADGGGSVGTLSDVLANGNSAGALDIDMNDNNIDNVNILGVAIVAGPVDADLTISSGVGFDIVIASDVDIYLTTGTNGQLYINGDAGTAGQVLTSGGAVASPEWADGAGGAETLSEVLGNGNDAGGLDIDNLNQLSVSSILSTTADIDITTTTGDILLVSSDNISMTIGATSVLFINSDAGTAGQVLTSNGTAVAPTWSDIETLIPTLEVVLSSGNSAGGLSIDMNNNDITNVLNLDVINISSTVDITLDAVNINLNPTGDLILTLNPMSGAILINGDAGMGGQVLTSGGSVAPYWSSGGGSVGTLSEVLTNGNSAGALSIDMNNNDIIDINSIAVSSIISAIDNDDINITTTTDGISIGDILITSAGNIWMGFGATSSLYINSGGIYSAGTVGQVLTSQGDVLPPSWSDTSSTGLASVLEIDNNAGAFDINLNNNSLVDVAIISGVFDSDIEINSTATMSLTLNKQLNINGNAGTLGQVLGSQGIDAPPVWVPVPFVPNFVFIEKTGVSGLGPTFTVALGASDVIPIGTYFCHYYFQIASGTEGQFINVNLSYNLNGVFNLGTVVQNSPDGNSVYMTGSYYFLQPVDGGAFGLDAIITLVSDVGITINPANDTSNYYALFQVATTA